MTDSQLLSSLLAVIRDYEKGMEDRLNDAKARILALEAEIAELKKETNQAPTLFEEVTDEVLQKRLASLQNSALDTIIREAGVVLENRLRQIAGAAGIGKHGTELVGIVLQPGRGNLIFSEHVAEQEGIFMLYRGAMQFVRNPPMHNLIEYQSSTAQLLLRLTDTLLRLLAEKQVQGEETTNIEDIKRMLTRLPIPNGQLQLYKALHTAGNTGLTNIELGRIMELTRLQIAGVLGALGNRINGTEGLQNKGGVSIVFEISRLNNGDWHYKLRPIMRRILEQERIV